MTDTNIDSDALKYILSLPRGRKVLWDILAVAGLYRQPRVAGDTEGTAFNTGSLNVGLIVFADCMAADPDLAATMIREQGTYDNVRSKPKPEPKLDTSGNSSSRPEAGGDSGSDASTSLPFSRYPSGDPDAGEH